MQGIKALSSLLALGLVACNSSPTSSVENSVETTSSNNSSVTSSTTTGITNTPASSSTGCFPRSELRQQMLALVNQARSQSRSCGGQLFDATAPVIWNTRLETAAQKHSDDMSSNNFFSHVGSNGSQFSDRVQDEGFLWRAIAENISAGRRSPSAVVNGWLNSAGHCANIMNPTYSEMGVACSLNSSSEFGTYYTQELGSQ